MNFSISVADGSIGGTDEMIADFTSVVATLLGVSESDVQVTYIANSRRSRALIAGGVFSTTVRNLGSVRSANSLIQVLTAVINTNIFKTALQATASFSDITPSTPISLLAIPTGEKFGD